MNLSGRLALWFVLAVAAALMVAVTLSALKRAGVLPKWVEL